MLDYYNGEEPGERTTEVARCVGMCIIASSASQNNVVKVREADAQRLPARDPISRGLATPVCPCI